MSINTLSMNLASFVISKYFPILSEAIELHGCLAIMSGTCVLGIIFVIFAMKETRGTSLDSIESGKSQAKAAESNSNNTV